MFCLQIEYKAPSNNGGKHKVNIFFPKGLCPGDFELLWREDGISNICAQVVISLCQFWGQRGGSRLVLSTLSPLFPIAARRKTCWEKLPSVHLLFFKTITYYVKHVAFYLFHYLFVLCSVVFSFSFFFSFLFFPLPNSKSLRRDKI